MGWRPGSAPESLWNRASADPRWEKAPSWIRQAPVAGVAGVAAAVWLFPGEGRSPGGAPAPFFALGWAPACAGELVAGAGRAGFEPGAGAACALAAAIATPFLRASSGMI